MGNIHKHNMNESKYTPVDQFQFLEPFEIAEEVYTNGLSFNGIYLPEELLINILNYIPPKKLLSLSLVCKQWFNIIKSDAFWITKYNRKFPNKAKKLPWYVYYCYFTTDNFNNMLKNGNGQELFKHWEILKNFGDEFKIEYPPQGCDPMPNVPEFNGYKSCFVTSFYECNKIQVISLKTKRLLSYILNKYNPHIYASEWIAGRFDCGSIYRLTIRGYSDSNLEFAGVKSFEEHNDDVLPPSQFSLTKTKKIEEFSGAKWEKVEIVIKTCPQNLTTLIFEHEGRDTKLWKGHYGSKMAGGVVKIVFDSIEPLNEQYLELNT